MAARVTGTSALEARLHAIGSEQGIMKMLGLRTVREAKLLVHRKTGHTGRSIRLASSSKTAATVVAGGAAAFLEFGTRPHTITPRAARALAWAQGASFRRLSGATRVGVSSANMTFAKVVHHPGSRPYPFLLPGAQKAIREQGVGAVVKLWNDAA